MSVYTCAMTVEVRSVAPLVFSLQVVMSCQTWMDARNKTQVLCKNSTRPSMRSILSRPHGSILKSSVSNYSLVVYKNKINFRTVALDCITLSNSPVSSRNIFFL